MMKKMFIVFFYIAFLVACTPTKNNSSVTITASLETPTLPLSSTARIPTSTPKNQHPSPTPGDVKLTATSWPNYSNLPSLAQLIITRRDACFAKHLLPVISQYPSIKVVDLTASTDPKYCTVDCIRHRWVAENGANLTFTVARLSSPIAATTLLREEFDRLQTLYSDRKKYMGVGFDDPYTDGDDNSWAGSPFPGTGTGYNAMTHSAIFMMMEWTQVVDGFDLEFDFSMTKAFGQLQFEKIDAALGTPFPSLTQKEKCSH